MKQNNKLIPIEKNTQKEDLFQYYLSNSQNHYKDISNYNYNHRIKLNPSGEYKTMEIRHQIPIGHIQDLYIKSIHYNRNKNKNAFEKANIQSKISTYIKAQKHQNILEKDKNINKLCKNKNKELKKILDNKKTKIKEELIRIIKDSLNFSKKNNPIKSMLPENINEIVEKVKNEAQDLSLNLNLSHISKISKISSLGAKSNLQKNEFLNLLGVDVENLNTNNINIDIDKCWNFILKLSKGRKVEDILRYKVVNEMMSITEKKSAEKVKNIYEKMDIYKKYMKRKKIEEKRRKKFEEEKLERILKKNSKEFFKKKMQKSQSQPRIFNHLELYGKKNKTNFDEINKKDIAKKDIKKGQKKMKRSESEIISITKKNVMKLDSYNDVNKIIDFIDNSKSNSQSKLYREHFDNILMTKAINSSLAKMIEKNNIFYK